MAKRPTTLPPTDVAQAWLLGGRRVSIEGIDLLPQKNNLFFKDTPFVIARGQAQAFYLTDAAGRVWILKKFLPGRTPDAQYVRAIRALVPQHPGFESGYQRRVLARASVAASPSADFDSWVENTILMPQVGGSDWAYIADRVREGALSLSREQRLLLCKSLSEKVRVLETNGLSHRDLSSTNIFIDTAAWEVHLIDWDSLFHPSLTIPPNTTYGTNGYVAPFVRAAGSEDPRVTWAPGADRFSLAVLNAEFLSVGQNSPVTGDGGLLDQDEIFARGGRGIDQTAAALRRDFPGALALFERALRADRFEQCPEPGEWIGLAAGVTAPSLKDVYDPQADFIKFIQTLQQVPPPPPAPALDDVPVPDFSTRFVTDDAPAGPPAPSLDDVEEFDPRALKPPATPATPAPPAPDLGGVEEASVPAAPAPAPAPAAPSLGEVEDLITGGAS